MSREPTQMLVSMLLVGMLLKAAAGYLGVDRLPTPLSWLAVVVLAVSIEVVVANVWNVLEVRAIDAAMPLIERCLASLPPAVACFIRPLGALWGPRF